MGKNDSDFFVISDNANSHHAFKHWLKDRTFNEVEDGKPDKLGNPILKLINKVSEDRFTKEGIICCLNGGDVIAKEIIAEHLAKLKGN